MKRMNRGLLVVLEISHAVRDQLQMGARGNRSSEGGTLQCGIVWGRAGAALTRGSGSCGWQGQGGEGGEGNEEVNVRRGGESG